MKGLGTGTTPCGCGRDFHESRLVAITGGPGAGKTAVLEMALRSFCSHVGVLPEAAGIVFGGGFPRRDSDVARHAAQRAIFHVQREVEAMVLGEGEVAVGLCDRGTIDGLAYWPGSEEAYWRELGTTLDDELRRYAAVIHLRTPSADRGYNRDNVLRIESALEARTVDERILNVWERHPNRTIVASDDEFVVKAQRALELIRAQLPSCCHAHPLRTETE